MIVHLTDFQAAFEAAMSNDKDLLIGKSAGFCGADGDNDFVLPASEYLAGMLGLADMEYLVCGDCLNSEAFAMFALANQA